MDHIVYLDAKDQELTNLQKGSKSMIIRGAMGRKLPYGRVFKDDVLYFAENNADGLIKAKATVEKAYFSDKLSREQSTEMVEKNQGKLQLRSRLLKRFAGKRYLCLISIKNIELIDPFSFDRSNYSNMDDWLFIEDIETVKSK